MAWVAFLSLHFHDPAFNLNRIDYRVCLLFSTKGVMRGMRLVVIFMVEK